MIILKLLRAHADRAFALLAFAISILALSLGYVGASGTPYIAEQIPYLLSGGITGIFLLGVAATVYLSADLRDEWRKLDDLDNRIAEAEESLTGSTGNLPDLLAGLERRLASLETVRRSRIATGANPARKPPSHDSSAGNRS